MSVLVPAQSFSSADAKRYVEAEQLTGFSGAAFTAWHHLARKMDVEVLRDQFTECGMENISTEILLGGMVVAISGQVGRSS